MRLITPIENSPEHAAALGRMLASWATLELNLIMLLALLLNVNFARAEIIFKRFVSLRSKLLLMEQLAYSFILSEEHKETILSFVKKSLDLNNTRNTFVHAMWACGEEKETLCMIKRSPPGNTKKRLPNEWAKDLSADDIQDFVEQIGKLSYEIMNFCIHVFPKVQISQEPIN